MVEFLENAKAEVVDVKDLTISKLNVRYEEPITKDEDWENLKRSIVAYGVIFPPIVTKDMKVIAGRRRVMACKELGIDKIKVIIVDKTEDEIGDAEVISFIENFHRKQMSVSQLRKIAERLVEKGLSLRRIAQVLSVSHETVANWLAVTKIDNPEIRKEIEKMPITKQVEVSKIIKNTKIDEEQAKEIIERVNKMKLKEVQQLRKSIYAGLDDAPKEMSVNINLPLELWKTLKDIALKQRTTISDLIVGAVKHYFGDEE